MVLAGYAVGHGQRFPLLLAGVWCCRAPAGGIFLNGRPWGSEVLGVVCAAVAGSVGERAGQAVAGLTITRVATNAAMAKTSQAKARCSRLVGSRVAIRPAAKEPVMAARVNAAAMP